MSTVVRSQQIATTTHIGDVTPNAVLMGFLPNWFWSNDRKRAGERGGGGLNAEIYLINEPANLRIHKFKAAKKNDHIFCAVTHTHMYHKCYYMLAFECKKHTKQNFSGTRTKTIWNWFGIGAFSTSGKIREWECEHVTYIYGRLNWLIVHFFWVSSIIEKHFVWISNGMLLFE